MTLLAVSGSSMAPAQLCPLPERSRAQSSFFLLTCRKRCVSGSRQLSQFSQEDLLVHRLLIQHWFAWACSYLWPGALLPQ